MAEHFHRTHPEIWELNSDRTPEVDRVTFTRVVFLRGEGCCSEDPMRNVTAYFDDDGRLMWQDDPATPSGSNGTPT